MNSFLFYISSTTLFKLTINVNKLRCIYLDDGFSQSIFQFSVKNIIIYNITVVDTICDLYLGVLDLYSLESTIIKYLAFIDSHIPSYSNLIGLNKIYKSIDIEESYLINSTIGSYIFGGGPMKINQHNFYMMNSTISDAIFYSIQNALFFIENATMKNSTAYNFIYLYNSDVIQSSKIKNLTLENNKFSYAVFDVSKSFLSIENATINNNYLDDVEGAIIYIIQSNVSISNTNIGPNNGSFFFGYFFVTSESILIAKDIVFTDNAGQLANSFYSYGNINILLDHCSFINSKGSSTDLVSFFDKSFYIRNSLFINSFKESMRIFWILNQLIISSTRFENIPSYAIELINIPNALINSCTFTASPYYSKFESLRMQGIYAEVSNLDIHNSIFTNMRSDKDGGAIWTKITYSEIAFPSSNFRIWNSQFINCSATRGGAIFLSVQPINSNSLSSKPLFSGFIAKSSFSNNTAAVSGGALAFSCDKNKINCKFNITDTVFSRNLVIKSESYMAVKYFYSNISSSDNIAEESTENYNKQVLGPPSIIKLINGKKKLILAIEEKDCRNRAISKLFFI